MSKKGGSQSQGGIVDPADLVDPVDPVDPVNPSPGSGHHPQHLLQELQVTTPLHICITADLFLLLLLFFS